METENKKVASKEGFNIKDFPITYKNKKFYNSKGEDLKKKDEDFYQKLVLCANYGRRALLKKKMKTFPDISLGDAEFFAQSEMLKEGYELCLPEQTEYVYTIRVIDSKNIKVKPQTKVLNFRTKLQKY